MCMCANASSSGVSSCAGQGGRIGRRRVSRRRTGRAWRPCASDSDASARRNGRNASRSCPTYTCTASHLQEQRKHRVKVSGALLATELTFLFDQFTSSSYDRGCYITLMVLITLIIIKTDSNSLGNVIQTVGWRDWANWLYRKTQPSDSRYSNSTVTGIRQASTNAVQVSHGWLVCTVCPCDT